MLYLVIVYECVKVLSIGDIDGGDCYIFNFVGVYQVLVIVLNVGKFVLNIGGVIKFREFSQEVCFVSEDMNGLCLFGGVYYFYQDLSYIELFYVGMWVLMQNIVYIDINENIGVFGLFEYKVVELLMLCVGVCYSYDDKCDVVLGFMFDVIVGFVFLLMVCLKGGQVLWDVSVIYVFSGQVNVYGCVVIGYLFGVIQDCIMFGSVQIVVDKQIMILGEGGIKGGNVSYMLNFDLIGYWWWIKNLQLIVVGGVSNLVWLLNVDYVVGYGVEVMIELWLFEYFVFIVGGSYNFIEICDFLIGVSFCGLNQCIVIDLVVNGFVWIDGNDLFQVLCWVVNWIVCYGVLVSGGEVYVYIDWVYCSEINYFLYIVKEFCGCLLFEGGLKIVYVMDVGIEVVVFLCNIINQICVISVIDFNNLIGMINDLCIIGGLVKFVF